jgi:copper resistance protein D
MGDTLALVRAVHLLATLLIAGTLLFRVLVAEPVLAEGRPDLVIRLRQRSRAIILTTLLVALASGAVWFSLIAEGLASEPENFIATSWALLTQTQFGFVWQLRFVLVILCLVTLTRRRENVRWKNAVAVGISALLAGTLAWAGHGSATPGELGYLHILADILHLVAAAAWLGGLVPLVMTLGWILERAEGDVVLVNLLRRYSTLGVVAVSGLVVSGTLNTLFIPADVATILSSRYGQLLTVKLVLFLVMIGFAGVNRSRLTPALSSAGVQRVQRAEIAWRIQRNTLAELALGVVIVVLTGWLGIMTPAEDISEHLH